jgi:ADP-heptose:LPS heptosyltransferase
MILRIRGSLGDEVALTALPREIRKHYPTELIAVDCNRPELFKTNPNVWPVNEAVGRDIHLQLAPDYAVGNLVHQYAKQIGLPVVTNTNPDLYLTQEELQDFRKYTGAVAIDHWAGWPRRRWSIDKWNRLAEMLKESGKRVIEVGKTVPDCTGTMRFGRIVCAEESFVDRLLIRQTAALLSKCSYYIGSDAGLMHVAASVFTTQVALYAIPWYGTAYRTTIPVFPLSHPVCHCREWCVHSERKIDEIEPEHVMQALQ